MATPSTALAVTRPASTASPTAQEMQDWATISDVLLWAGFNENPTDHGTPAYELLSHLGYNADDAIAQLGTVPVADLNEELATWTINEARPSLALRNRARQAGHAARVFIGVDWTLAQTQEHERAELEHKREMEWYAAQAPPPPVVGSAPPTPLAPVPTGPVGRTVNFSDVADAARKDDIKVLTVPAMDEMRDHYISVTRNRHGPPDNCEPTAEADGCYPRAPSRRQHPVCRLRHLGAMQRANSAENQQLRSDVRLQRRAAEDGVPGTTNLWSLESMLEGLRNRDDLRGRGGPSSHAGVLSIH